MLFLRSVSSPILASRASRFEGVWTYHIPVLT
jgi:hypothetical protein